MVVFRLVRWFLFVMVVMMMTSWWSIVSLGRQVRGGQQGRWMGSLVIVCQRRRDRAGLIVGYRRRWEVVRMRGSKLCRRW